MLKTVELQKLIAENPDCEIMVRVDSEDVDRYEYSNYAFAEKYLTYYIDELTLYKDNWIDKSELEDTLRLDLEWDYDYLSEEEFYALVEEKMKEYTFQKYYV